MMDRSRARATKAELSAEATGIHLEQQQDESYHDKLQVPPVTAASRYHPKVPTPQRIFNFTQLAAFAITFMSSWEVMALNMGGAFYNGGPQVLTWGVLLCSVGGLAQALSLAELSAIRPIAGAQYHWTELLAPEPYRRLITWMQGWVTWFAWVSLLAGVAAGTSNILLGTVIANYPDTYVEQPWHITVTIIAQFVFAGLINAYAFQIIPWLEVVAGVLHVVLFVIYIAILLTFGGRNSANFVFLEQTVYSGWENNFVSWNIGLLIPAWGFVGFDAVVHMAEETRRAKKAVPRVMVWCIVCNAVMAFTFVLALLFSIDHTEEVLASPWPIVVVLISTAGTSGGTALLAGLLTISMFVLVACVASVSRITWSWARDGALPTWFARVDPRHHIPIRGLLLPCAIVILLSLFTVGNTATVTVFSAFTALSSLGLYTSYFIAISCLLHARLSGRLGDKPTSAVQYGDWRLPSNIATPINIYALLWTIYITIWLPFPTTIPVTGANMNYAGPIYLVVVIGAVTYWITWGRKNWPGLNKSPIEMVAAHD
ncbi:LPXTG-domain-containing protein [Nemania abortiva]|nr:LPXTG-domain-containing protein [Nemania abortiva]